MDLIHRDLIHRPVIDYLVQTILYFRDTYNISFMSVAPFSEPTANWYVLTTLKNKMDHLTSKMPNRWVWNNQATQEGCHFDLSSVISFVSTLAGSLKDNQLSTQIASPDEVAYSYTQSTLQSIPTADYADFQKINTHGYFDPPNSERASFAQVARSLNKKVWMSELGTGGQGIIPVSPGIRDLGGIGLARQIVADIYYIGVTAWVYWQALETNSVSLWITVSDSVTFLMVIDRLCRTGV